MAGTTTVLFADISGSSRLVSALGDMEAAKTVNAHLGLLRLEAERVRGKVLKTLGDGLMAVFATVYEAVQAAIAMQAVTELGERQGRFPVMGLRVGIHVGDVVEDDSDDILERSWWSPVVFVTPQDQARSSLPRSPGCWY
jgi:adenylate cyclase